jgi:hypothetical protein
LPLDLPRFGKSAELLFGEDELVFYGNFKDSSAAFDELGLDAKILLDFRCQTGGARVVVSSRAVFDGNPHRRSPFRPNYRSAGRRHACSARGRIENDAETV